MDILHNVSVQQIYIKTFFIPQYYSVNTSYTSVTWQRYQSEVPKFIQYEPFKTGYINTFLLTTCADLDYIPRENLMTELVFNIGGGKYLRLGDENGFKVNNITQDQKVDSQLNTYYFEAVKPSYSQYQLINFNNTI